MQMRLLSLAALSVHVLVGNLCLMPMAIAEEPVTHAQHDAAAMADDAEEDNDERTDCSGGHCIIPALPTDSSENGGHDAPEYVPPTFDVPQQPRFAGIPARVYAAPPGQFIHVRTIVLRN